MSAPTVLTTKTDIDLMVSAFVQTGAGADLYGDDIDAARIGRILWSENLAGARVDLPDRDWSDEESEVSDYTFHEYVGINLGSLTRVIYMYEAETCERAGWRQSEAYAIVHALYRRQCRIFQSPR